MQTLSLTIKRNRKYIFSVSLILMYSCMLFSKKRVHGAQRHQLYTKHF
jgi:hypothetical protein